MSHTWLFPQFWDFTDFFPTERAPFHVKYEKEYSATFRCKFYLVIQQSDFYQTTGKSYEWNL